MLAETQIVPEGHIHTLLLDGHNRLATVAWIMGQGGVVADPSDAESRVWASGRLLVLDARAGKVRFADRASLPDLLWIGAETLMGHQMRPVWEHVQALTDAGWSEEDTDLLLQTHERFNRAFMGCKATVTSIVDASPEEAKDAFLAICRTGVPISGEDIDRAMGWAIDEDLLSPVGASPQPV